MLQIYAYDGTGFVRPASAVRVLSPQASAPSLDSLERIAGAEGGKTRGCNAGFVSFDFHVSSFSSGRLTFWPAERSGRSPP